MKRKVVKLLLAAAVMAPAAFNAYAVPARPGLINFTQGDGSTVKVRLVGDESFHYYLTEDGYLLKNVNDCLYYADIDESGTVEASSIRATDVAGRDMKARNYLGAIDRTELGRRLDKAVKPAVMRRMAPAAAPAATAEASKGPGLFAGTSFPSMGDQKAIVVLVQYADVKFNLSDPYDYFNRMLNERGFSSYGGTGSAVDYFEECSDGQFRPQFDVYGPITLSREMSYYGGNDYYGNDKYPHKMIIEACQQLDSKVNFADYDRDGDGYIDNVFVFYAGRGEADGGGSNTVWPHSYDITSAEPSTAYRFDGKRLDRYGCTNEWSSDGRPDGVGTFCHEFSHVMGLPDLYATSYTGAFTPGDWSALDSGPYNNNGCTPPLYSAFERYALGWMEPRVIDGPADITLKDIGHNEACIIPTGDPDEFFLLENRQQKSWDKYIPGHGMLVWHIDYDSQVWTNNVVNNTSSHQYVDLEEADNRRTESTRAGDAFPGTSKITSFTDQTSPSMKTWGGKSLGLPVTDITESNGVITFKVAGGKVYVAPAVATEATEVTPTSFVANWEASADAESYMLAVEKMVDGKAQELKEYTVGNVTSYKVEDLEPSTVYAYTVIAYSGNTASDPSEAVSVTTLTPTFDMLKVTALEPTALTTSSFNAEWEAIDDAVGYELAVYEKEVGDPLTQTADFTGGISNMPQGWSTSSKLTYATAGYYGEAAPSLRMNTDKAYLMTPQFDDFMRQITFWHRGIKADEANTISVEALVGEKWVEVKTIPVTNDAGGATVTVGGFPDNTVAARIVYNMPGSGAIAIDDVVAGHGGVENRFHIDGYGPLKLGNVTSATVSGLTPGHDYFYRVRATDGELFTPESNEIAVTLDNGNSSGVTAPAATSAVTVSVNGLAATFSGLEQGSRVDIFDIAGRKVASAVAGTSGVCRLTLPARGVYVATASDNVFKIVAK